MNGIDSTLQRLGSGSLHGYGTAPLPCPMDEEIESLVLAIAVDNEIRASARSNMNQDHGFALLAYAERMASLAVRDGEAARLDRGLVALGLGSTLTDVRDALPVASILHSAAEKLGTDVQALFLRTTEILKSDMHPYVAGFTNRSKRDRSIQAMGFIESEDEQGFRYKRIW